MIKITSIDEQNPHWYTKVFLRIERRAKRDENFDSERKKVESSRQKFSAR